MSRAKCVCGKLLLETWGNRSSNVVVISDAPLFDDVKNGVLYSGAYGEALKNEMSKMGIQPSGTHMMTLWKHGQDKECTYDHATEALKILKDAKLILMLGSECLSTYTGYTAMEVSGTIVKSKMIKGTIVAGPSITTLGKTPIGELKLALELFAEQRRKLK